MESVQIHHGNGYVRYLSMPGFYEAWTYDDDRRPVYACQCAPVTTADIPSSVVAELWTAMNKEAGFVPLETDRTIWTKSVDREVWS